MIDRNRLCARFAQLVSIDAPGLHERKMADTLKEIFHETGIELTEDDSHLEKGYEAGNLYAYVPGEISALPLLFSGHMDTVEPSRGKKAVFHEDGTITGNGTAVLGADDMGGVSAIIEAVVSILEEGLPHRPFEILFTWGEELYCQGSAAFDMSRIRSKEAYVFDCSGPVGSVSLKEPTLIRFVCEVHGKSSHAGFAPEEGINAIAAAAHIISAIPQGRQDEDTTVNIGTLSGGTATNIVSDYVRFDGEIRSYSDEKAKDFMRRLRETAEAIGEKAGASVHMEETQYLTAYRIDPEDSVVKRFVRCAENAGVTPILTATLGGSDCNTFNRKGLTGINCASAMNRVHTLDEWTSADELYRTALIAQALMCSED